MSDLITCSVDIGPLLGQLKNAQALTKQDMSDLIRQQATLFVYNPQGTGTINLMPPFSAGVKGKAGLEAGKGRIDADLGNIFAGRTLKGQRILNHLFGDRNPAVGNKPPYTIKTQEKWPDVKSIYVTRNGRRHGRKLTRGQRSAYYVDKAKLDQLRKELHARVGWACACWWKAAVTAGLSPRGVPSWVKRHGSAPGNAIISLAATSFAITLISDLDYNGALNIENKVRKALQYREDAIKRRLPYLIRHAMKNAGLQAA